MSRSGDQDTNRFFDDFARMATGAVGAMSSFRQHLRQEIKSHLDRFLIELDLVPRSDFEIVEQMAKQARADNEDLKKRITALEAVIGAKENTPKAKDTAKKETKSATKTAAKTIKKTDKKTPAKKKASS
jgi:BMFP domain-containing protein YqiC